MYVHVYVHGCLNILVLMSVYGACYWDQHQKLHEWIIYNCNHTIQWPELLSVGRLPQVGVTRAQNFHTESVCPKKIRSCFSASQNFFLSRKTLIKHVFPQKVQLFRSSFSHISEVAFSTSEKLCLAPFPSSTPSLLSRLPFLSRNVLPQNQTTQR